VAHRGWYQTGGESLLLLVGLTLFSISFTLFLVLGDEAL